MCGIAGIIARHPEPAVRRRVESMVSLLEHRGPDDQGLHVEPCIALGMTRLSIVDLGGGHQPMSNEDGSVWTVYNGEIYNHPSLRAQLLDRGHAFTSRCDTEVLVHAYEEWGADFVQHLNGMFALAIWDRRRQSTLLARDRVGIKPLFYRETAAGLAFASELTALLADPDSPREIDAEALTAYLTLEFVPNPLSLIRGIQTLEPGHLLTWSADCGSQHRRYWDIPLGEVSSASAFDEAARLLEHKLAAAVSSELVSDVPIGVLLSGGVDSSTVAAMMVAAMGSGSAVASFSVGFDDPDFDESSYAAAVARHLGTDHHLLQVRSDATLDVLHDVITRLDQPLGDPSLLPTYLVSRFAREHVKVVLGGDGGDELFGGYPTLRAHRLASLYQRLPGILADHVVPDLVNRLPTSMSNLSFDFKAKRFVQAAGLPLAERHVAWTGSLSPAAVPDVLSAQMRGAASRFGAHLVAERHLANLGSRDLTDQVLYLDTKLYLEGDILAKVDRASMANSLEARVPLLNAELVDFVARLPNAFKVQGRDTKRILRHAMRGYLPRSILQRPKRGFALPLARWLRGPLRQTVIEALSYEKVEHRGLADPHAVRRIVNAHMSGHEDNRKTIWTLFVLHRWCEHHLEPATTGSSRQLLETGT